jgi:hypothetical protein
MQKLSPVEAERLYRDLSDKVLAYLAEMDVALHWLSDMMRIPPDDIYIVPERQVRDELEGDARALFDLPSFAQWKLSKCGGLSMEEWDDLRSLALQAALGTLPKKMVGYHNYLESRLQEVVQCGHQAVIMARWQLRAAGRRN